MLTLGILLRRHGLAIGLVIWSGGWMPIVNAEPADSKSKSTAQAESEAESGEARYKVPNTKDVNALLKFIDQVRNYEPTDRPSLELHVKMALPAMKQAAERIVQLDKDKKSLAYKQASDLLLLIRLQSLTNVKPAEQQELLEEVGRRLKVDKLNDADLAIVVALMTVLETLDESEQPKVAAKVYSVLANALSKGDHEQKTLGQRFEGAIRRLDLVGKPLKITSTTADGKPFDIKSYAGKVVLLDFWTTWCGPCREELPKLKALYRAYHDRGFEIVGVNEDDDRAALDEFLTDEKLPWITLDDRNVDNAHPIAEQYGVFVFPTMILLGRDGKVVSLYARDKELVSQLAKLIGPVDAGGNKPTSNGPKK